MSDWQAIIDDTTGRLVSVGTVVVQLRPGLVAVPLTARPSDDDMWDETTRAFIPRPTKIVVDRLDDLAATPGFSQAITDSDQLAVLTIVGRLLGRERYRNQAENVNVGETPPVVRPGGR